MENLSPIALFAYNRADHISKCIESLQKNPLAIKTELYIFSDGPKNIKDTAKVQDVRSILNSATGFKQVHILISEENKGLANSIIQGVTMVLDKHEEIIVLEDDLSVSTDFIDFMNSALEKYKNESKVFSVSAYCAPIKVSNYEKDTFFFRRINSWGWATWKDRWKSVDWEIKDFNEFIISSQKRKAFNSGGMDLSMMLLKNRRGIINSWAIRFNYACFKQNKLNLYPLKSKVTNSGIDNSGTNTRKSKKFDTVVNHGKVSFDAPIEENKLLSKIYMKYLSPSIIRRIINWWKIKSYISRNK